MKKNRLFDIVTLSSNHRLADPVSILTGGVAVLSQLFPNIFGGGRRRLTETDWLQLLPGAGFYTTNLRNYLKARIHYDVDYTSNTLALSQQFAYDLRDQKNGFCDNCSNNDAYKELLSVLQDETNTGGKSPIGPTPGGYGSTLDYSTLVPLAIGAVALILVMKSKKRKK